jgi:bifunctional non-homologous end joining protein LigD
VLMLCPGRGSAGKEFFAETIAQGHEGVVAKHTSGRYRPGQRSAGWRKIKPVHVIPCVVIGYTPGPDGFHSLLVAAQRQGKLRYVGELTCGFTASAKAEGTAGLRHRPRAKPIVACPKRAQWVEPEWYCQVQFLKWTAHDRLHGASFQRWIAPRGILAPLPTGEGASAR